MAEESKVRLVRCPVCETVIPEVPEYSVYKCGSCNAVLRAKMLQSVSAVSGSGLTELRREEEWAAKEIHLTDYKHEVPELPKSPKYTSSQNTNLAAAAAAAAAGSASSSMDSQFPAGRTTPRRQLKSQCLLRPLIVSKDCYKIKKPPRRPPQAVAAAGPPAEQHCCKPKIIYKGLSSGIFSGDAKMRQSVPEASGSGLTQILKGEEWTAKEIHLTNDKHKVSELPESPNCSLNALYLQGNYELTVIPPLFFLQMAFLQVLDLSHTSIKSLPKSLPKLVSLKKLLLRGCKLFMELPPQIGKLKNLEELDLDETQIMDMPSEIGKLLKLRHLRVSFYHISGKRKLKANIMIHPESMSILSQLADLSIDVNPADKRWDNAVGIVVKEVCNSKTLKTLSLYLPEFQLLDNISLIYPSLSRFRFTVGHQKRRTISRVPNEVEAKFRDWDKCLKFVNGENIPVEIKGVLNYSTSFFLDNHATAMNLSEFGIKNMKRLKYCLLAECNEMETLVDSEMHYKRNEDDHSEPGPGSVEHVLESLEYLSIYYMENLESIWRGPKHYRCMSELKFLALHMCPKLTKIFSHTLLESFDNLEEIILEDCPQVTSLVSHTSVKPMLSDRIFLPSLKRLLLLYLPELISISNGLLIAPKLESIGCYNCPKLKSISKMELSSNNLKIIKGECKWWEDMSWNEIEWGNRPDFLMHIFSPINNEKDVMAQLAEDSDLLEATIGNENQLGYMGERITETDVTKSTPPPCILPSIPPLSISKVPKQAWSFSPGMNKRPENDFGEVDGDQLDKHKAERRTFRIKSDCEVLDDGYRWRKYGKKSVKNSANPRNYYKCSTSGCPVKRRIERDSKHPSYVITTYEGVHNHESPFMRVVGNRIFPATTYDEMYNHDGPIVKDTSIFTTAVSGIHNSGGPFDIDLSDMPYQYDIDDSMEDNAETA